LNGVEHLFDLAHAAGQRKGGHLKIGMVGNATVFAIQRCRRLPQLRQLSSYPPEILLVILPLVARLRRANVVVNHAVDFQKLRLVLDLLGVLKKAANHPGMGQDDVQPLDGFGRRHGVFPRAAVPLPLPVLFWGSGSRQTAGFWRIRLR